MKRVGVAAGSTALPYAKYRSVHNIIHEDARGALDRVGVPGNRRGEISWLRCRAFVSIIRALTLALCRISPT